jgi:hypothetical protein
MNLLNIISMSCRQATYLHEKKKQGSITTTEQIGLWWHLIKCRFCAFFYKQLDHLEDSTRNLGIKAEQQITLPPERKAAIQKNFDQQKD